MSFSESSALTSPQSPSLVDGSVLVREILSVRSQATTPDQERRLVKTLERLHPAANVALAGSAGSPDRSFESVLADLSSV